MKPEIFIEWARRCEVNTAYYQKLFPKVQSVTVSDRCPNPPGYKASDYGWEEVEELPKGYTSRIFYKNASLGGRARIYIEAY